MECKEKIKELRECMGMNRREFCEYFQIPYRTVTEWELGNRHAPEYVLRLLEHYIWGEKKRDESDTDQEEKEEHPMDAGKISKGSTASTIKKSTGLIHIYCGDGKGKTTTGMGLCARAAGYGLRVLIYQFMKNNSTSERKVLALSENITLVDGLPQEKFSFQMTAEEKAERKAYYENQLCTVTRKAQEEDYDVLFLDEVIYTIRAGLLEEALLLEFLRNKPAGLEVILTGQGPGQELIELADYVSEIKKVRHPFDKGIRARGGIES